MGKITKHSEIGDVPEKAKMVEVKRVQPKKKEQLSRNLFIASMTGKDGPNNVLDSLLELECEIGGLSAEIGGLIPYWIKGRRKVRL
ncbi:hypothetical protein Ancab_007685 [Ancistrocladus abbreviatus]